MPRKKRDYRPGGIYHISNKGVDGRKVFLDKNDYCRFLLALEFFNCSNDVSLWEMFFSDNSLCGDYQEEDLRKIVYKRRVENNKNRKIVDFLAFSLLPDSYHFILREIETGGISLFMKKLGGYVVYFNKKYTRSGSLFESRYKSRTIESKEDLKKIFYSIHAKPFRFRKKEEDSFRFLCDYGFSSLRDYTSNKNYSSVTNRGFLLDLLGGKNSIKKDIEMLVKQGELRSIL
jgi:putative transposase